MSDLISFFSKTSVLQELRFPEAENANLKLYIKREDLLHPGVSGNKWRKLKYNLLEVVRSRKKGIITFGGAYSNHLHAVSEAGKVFDIATAGIVRGEQPDEYSETLKNCLINGMELHFVSRETYREKEKAQEIKEIIKLYPDFLLIPEGGENNAARKGCAELMEELPFRPDYVCVPCGTGTTLSGLCMSSETGITYLGFAVLKGAENSITENIIASGAGTDHVKLISDYHFGGYAKHSAELISFIQDFEKTHTIPLEQVYTGKMMYGITDLIRKKYFVPGSSIVAVHTGGLQGRLPLLDRI